MSILLAPGAVNVRFSPDPVYSNLASPYLLDFAGGYTDIDE
jgi:hypothetical protein